MKNDFPRIYISPEVRHRMIDLAREFRKQPTKGEEILWEALRRKKLDGIKFRRQQPIGYFIVDFYNSVYRLVIEVDGPVHETQWEADNARQKILEDLGLTVFRIKSELVEKNSPDALGLIREAISDQTRLKETSSPHLGEGKGGG